MLKEDPASESGVVMGFCSGCGILRTDSDGAPVNECICLAKRRGHADGCRYLFAVSCPISVPCIHGDDVCEVCTPCTCSVGGVHTYYNDGKGNIRYFVPDDYPRAREMKETP